MINRRGLLKTLACIVPGGAVVVAGLNLQLSEKSDDEFVYDGWRVKWRNWIPFTNQDALVGVWYAYKDGERNPATGYYSAWPGNAGAIRLGNVMDLSMRTTQFLITSVSSDEDKEFAKAAARARILAVIDAAKRV